MYLRVGSVCDGLWQVDPVAHVGNASERVDQGSVRAAYCPAIWVAENSGRTLLIPIFSIKYRYNLNWYLKVFLQKLEKYIKIHHSSKPV